MAAIENRTQSTSNTFGIPGVPFPIGTEYYRAPTPKAEVWDEDFTRIRKAGFHIVRSFSFWNWMEPAPGVYNLEVFDRLLDTAAKHNLYFWLDITLATHGACPEWLVKEHPDILMLNFKDEPHPADAHPAFPQGGQRHCYDHPAWEKYGGALLRHVINRYKDHPAMLIWGLWDGTSPAWPWRHGNKMPCYCLHTRERYRRWLQARFTLDEFNERYYRQYRHWGEVEPPRDKNNVIEMLSYFNFHYENLCQRLQWMVDETKKIDPIHETRAHAASTPRPWDELVAPIADSWGMSMGSNNLLTDGEPYKIADRAFCFDWSRSSGKSGRWWNEEIYSGMARGGVTWKKQTDPRELTMLLWMSLIGGASGTLFWQYRPEYLSFEGPGYNLIALDGEPTERFHAVTKAVGQIEQLSPHLPLVCPRAEVAIIYHPESQELFGLNEETQRFNSDLRGVYRTLWRMGIPADVVTPRMDWTGYKLIFLPNLALMDKDSLNRIEQTLDQSPETRLVMEGSFGIFDEKGVSSYNPPEGLADRLGFRVADFSAVTEYDIRQGLNVVATPYGEVTLTVPCGYAVLEPRNGSKSIATLGAESVAVRSQDERVTWFGFTLSAGFADYGNPLIVRGLTDEAGIAPPVEVEGDPISTEVRRSNNGGQLVFAMNMEPREARVSLRPSWPIEGASDLLNDTSLEVTDNTFQLSIPQWEVAVIHCT